MTPIEVKEYLHENRYGEVIQSTPIGGGCISNGRILTTENHDSFFLKTNQSVPEDFFQAEALGLNELHIPEGPTVPDVHLVGSDFILMENLRSAPRTDNYWEVFGERMAVLHNKQATRHGFQSDNYIGSTQQINSWNDDGITFFTENRLLFMVKLAFDKKVISSKLMKDIETLSTKLQQLILVQPAALLHGDLWSGNAISDSNGLPAIIDPAVYYGFPEADLAMTTLFGAFPQEFYDAYRMIIPLERGYRDRFDLYNIYHLLNHAVLFGGGYIMSVARYVSKFV